MPRGLDHYKLLWSLKEDGESFRTSSSLLQPVLCEGRKCILKIAVHHEEERGNGLMFWWDGEGAAKALKYDKQALLMERATGTRSLPEMAKAGRDGEASRILCGAVAKLHHHGPPYPDDLVPLSIWFIELGHVAASQGGVFPEARLIADELLAKQKDIVALHGDIHHGNVLDFCDRGWLAIDPKGLIGDRGFDYANIFCNPDAAIATSPGRLMRQVNIIAEASAQDPKRLLQWIAAWAGLSAAWSMTDGADPEPAMTVAKIAIASLQS